MADDRVSLLPAGVVLGEVARLLDRIEPDRSGLAPQARLEWVAAARRVAGRVEALACLLLAEADAVGASLTARGTPMSSWLGLDHPLSKREAAGALIRARKLGQHPVVAHAAARGTLGIGQARAISQVLGQLAVHLGPEQCDRAEAVLLGLAATMDADRLGRAAGRVLETVDPQRANELNERRLQQQAETAHRQRRLRFFGDAGSVRFDGSLPRVDAEAWMALLDAHAESQRRAVVEARDPVAEPATPEQRRADALIGMIGHHHLTKQAPTSGGDRPRILVRLDYHRLVGQAAAAGLISLDEPLSAGDLRRLCCDAGLVPAVLGTASEVLDVGREHRLVTPAIRTALTLRDGGCAFPTCRTRPAVCEAHHIRPWWDGGPTALTNLVMLCHHHHSLIEPAKHSTRDQWEVRLAADGHPEFLPPARQDPQRRPQGQPPPHNGPEQSTQTRPPPAA